MEKFIMCRKIAQGRQTEITVIPKKFRIEVKEANDVIFVNFVGITLHEPYQTIIIFVDEEENGSAFHLYSDKGQKLIMRMMTEYIIEDIINFFSNKPTDPFDTMPIKNHRYFDINEFESRWYTFYDMITDCPEVADEHIDSRKNRKFKK